MRALSLVAALGTAVVIGTASLPARADWDDGWHHRHHHHGWAVNGVIYEPPGFYPPVYYAPAPVYEVPPPVYYAPPPVYYAPPPVYYAPAPIYVPPAVYRPVPLSGISLGFSFGR